MEKLEPFMWVVDREELFQSDVYNKLIHDGRSSMTEEECKEYGAMTGNFDMETQIEEIKSLRKEMLEDIKDMTEEALGMTHEEFVRDAYPFEILFVIRY